MLYGLIMAAAVGGLFAAAFPAQCTDRIYSPTYGKPASKFVTGCEVFHFGEYLEPIEGPDGTLGYLIEKTDSAVTINGRHHFSPYDPPRRHIAPPSEKAERGTAVSEQVRAEVRSLAQAHPTREDAYYIKGELYTDQPRPYVTEKGDTVMLQLSKDWARMVYEDVPLQFPLRPKPAPPKEEQDAFGLDVEYHSLVSSIKPGRIILIGRGYKFIYPLSVASKLKNALAKIPSLAERRHKDLYGEWVYEPLTIDGFQFGYSITADFAEK